MTELRVVEFMSLDGVIQSPGDPEEDTEGGFRHGGWQREYFDDVLASKAGDGMTATARDGPQPCARPAQIRPNAVDTHL
jgi:hypothetical protein